MDPKQLSDQELLQHCLDAQDDACWTEFVCRFQRLIGGVAAKCLFRWMGRPDQALVEDLIHETYLKLCKNNYKALRDFDFRDEKALRKFLKVVASHVAEDYIRQQETERRGCGHEEVDLETVSLFVPSNPGATPRAETETFMGEIERCLAERVAEPNYHRDSAIFWLYYRHGLTAVAIASIPGIGLSVKGVESTLLRLTRYVRGKMGPSGKTPGPPGKRRAAGR